MPRPDGEKTKARILEVAQELFSIRGYDATSMDKIAKAANVNKALIYYHFKNKNDLVFAVFMNSLNELDTHLRRSDKVSLDSDGRPDLKSKIRYEIEFLKTQKKSMSVLLTESLKSGAKENYLYKLAEVVINDELGKIFDPRTQNTKKGKKKLRYARLFEFFTGFIPVIAFIALKESWCEYFEYDEDEALELFLEAFEASHLSAQFKKQ